MTEQLKPCPFCGGKAQHIDAAAWSEVLCLECAASIEETEALDGHEAWNRRAQPAQAVPVLTDAEIDTAYEKARVDYQRSRFRVCGQQLTASDSFDWWFARAIEQAVRAKMGVAVPMTREAVKSMMDDSGYANATPQERADFISGIRHAEKFHGIVGKEGA